MVLAKDLFMYYDDMVEWRREFHSNPELGFQEYNTSKKVTELLESFGLKVHKEFSGTSIIGVLDTGKEGKVVGIRADIDALPMDDLKDVPYKSKNKGVCHACGHDMHTAILLGVAKYFSEHKEELVGKLKFVFQAAEEGPAPGGAKLIMKAGLLDDVDIMLGAHTHPGYETGTIIFKNDEMFAGGDFFDIKLIGSGGHGAYPNTCLDLIASVGGILGQFQNIISREIEPTKTCILSICGLNAGELGAKNVIPHELNMSGTIRYLHKPTRDFVVNKIRKILDGFCELNDCRYEFINNDMFPILRNNNNLNAVVRDITDNIIGSENVHELPNVDTASEDFSYYSDKIPSCYFYFGVKNDLKNCNATFHHPLFDADEECMPAVQSVFINSATALLKK